MGEREFTSMVKVVAEAVANDGDQTIKRALEAVGQHPVFEEEAEGTFVRFNQIQVTLQGGTMVFEYFYKSFPVCRQVLPAVQDSAINLGKFDGKLPVAKG